MKILGDPTIIIIQVIKVAKNTEKLSTFTLFIVKPDLNDQTVAVLDNFYTQTAFDEMFYVHHMVHWRCAGAQC